MRILYFHQHFSTPRGSTGTRSYEMARELIARGHQVTMVCGSFAMGKTQLESPTIRGIRRGNVDGIDVVEICLPYSNHDRFVKRAWTFIRYAAKSVRLALTTKYDLLFATSTPLTAAIPGIAMRFLKPTKPFVFEVRDLWPELPREMGVIKNPLVLGSMSVLEWLAYNCANGCIGLSPGIVAGIQRRCSSNKPVKMIPNGCDLKDFVPQPFAKPSGTPRLRAVFTGAHGIANGLDAVLDMARVLKERGRRDIEVMLIGDGKLKPQLVARAEREQLDNCHFLTPVPKTLLAQQMAEVEVGLMVLANVPAFYYGTSPNKFFDYVSSGLPVVNNYPGWLADLIAEHGCGIAVPPNDPEAFADALVRLADNRELRMEMGANARQLAESHFDRAKLAGQFAVFLEEFAPFTSTDIQPLPAPARRAA
jgi:glycosyltransferase involved in cell wall biosynthesis